MDGVARTAHNSRVISLRRGSFRLRRQRPPCCPGSGLQLPVAHATYPQLLPKLSRADDAMMLRVRNVHIACVSICRNAAWIAMGGHFVVVEFAVSTRRRS